MKKDKCFTHLCNIVSLTPITNEKGEIIYNFLIKNMKIKALPKRLRELSEKYIKEQQQSKVDPNLSVDNIIWRDTKEGNLFWKMVNEGEFGEARKIYDWDFMEETLPGKDMTNFEIELDEDWFKSTTWENWDWKSDTCMLEWGTLSKRLNDIFKQEYEKLSKEERENIIKRIGNEEEILKPIDFSKNIKPEKIKGWIGNMDFSNPKPEELKNDFKDITDSIAKLLEYKNKQYGNSALEPLQIFGGKCTYGSRVDEKLARVKNSKELRKNDIADILGGLVLICREKKWNNFDEYLVD